MNLVFQIEALTNSEGESEFVSVECEPTTDEPSDDVDAQELGAGAWEFTFVLPAGFDGTEAIFRKFGRYRLTADAVYEACADAARAAQLAP
jgi:hypothetical protein